MEMIKKTVAPNETTAKLIRNRSIMLMTRGLRNRE